MQRANTPITALSRASRCPHRWHVLYPLNSKDKIGSRRSARSLVCLVQNVLCICKPISSTLGMTRIVVLPASRRWGCDSHAFRCSPRYTSRALTFLFSNTFPAPTSIRFGFTEDQTVHVEPEVPCLTCFAIANQLNSTAGLGRATLGSTRMIMSCLDAWISAQTLTIQC
jgi:hypothetical protein